MMNRMYKATLLITTSLLAIATVFVGAVPAHAQGGYGLDQTAETAFEGTDLERTANIDPGTVAGRIIATILSFLGIIMLGIVIYAGFLWMTAGGNQDKVGRAIKLITNASIGLLIILAAYLITRYIGTALMNVLS